MFLKKLHYLLILLLCCLNSFAQQKDSSYHRIDVKDSENTSENDSLHPVYIDSATIKDSLNKVHIKYTDSVKADSLKKVIALKASLNKNDTATFRYLMDGNYFPFWATPIKMFMPERKPNSKDMIFYILLGLVMILAIIRIIFTKYIRNLFTLFFQTSFRQNQTRDQMSQNSIASLLTNLTFI